MMANVRSIFLEGGFNFLADVGGRGADDDSGGGHGGHFVFALPLPPEMIAPAWPMRRPGGAVWPAMKPITGFFTCSFIYAAASSSALRRFSPIMTMTWVSGSSFEKLDWRRCGSADDGVASDADTGGLADVEIRQLADGFVSKRAGARDYATWPAR